METEITSDSRNFAVLAHLSTFVGYVIPFGNVFSPFLLMMLKPDDRFVRAHAVECLNYNISLLVWALIATVLCVVLVGFPLLFLILIGSFIFPLIAASRAMAGNGHRYPMTFRFLS